MTITKRVKVVALKSFRYGTRQLMAGDEFEVMPMERRTLNAMGKTKDGGKGKAKAKEKAEATGAKVPHKSEKADKKFSQTEENKAEAEAEEVGDKSYISDAEVSSDAGSGSAGASTGTGKTGAGRAATGKGKTTKGA